MPTSKEKPVIFLAIANDAERPLPGLEVEYRQVMEALTEAQEAGLCDVVSEPFATRKLIFDKFSEQRFRNRIAVLHYAGHAGADQLHLTSEDGISERANAEGLARLLAQQTSLQLVFLNGCGTLPQVKGLLKANVPVVIATSTAIADRVAKIFSSRFYRSLADGAEIYTAFKEAEAEALMPTEGKVRDLYAEGPPPTQEFPWQLHVRPGSDVVEAWSLPKAVDNPLFGLPPVPLRDLPEKPFRHLNWFGPEHAEVFFGRGYQIRDLYTRITTSDSPPIILFYGQSGVGKSSILEAGLLPRLEAGHEVQYRRRDPETGLLSTLHEALRAEESEVHPEDTWRGVEAKLNRPVVILLDQVEEIFTRPNQELPNELQALCDELHTIFDNPDTRPNGKLVLSFRKEWLAEIERHLVDRKLPRAKLFVERLDRRGVMEAILGPSLQKRHIDQYGLTIEEGLPEIIADDLLADPGSPLAPTLQILLTKMWERATERDHAHPHFDKDLYEQLRREGILLTDFLEQQLAKLEQWNPEILQSGFVLDLLVFHTTSLGTTEERMLVDLEERYSHQSAILGALTQQCKDKFLLVEARSNSSDTARSTRLAHDTLAPLIRSRFEESDKPGQRALHILENRALEWRGENKGTPLEETDLKTVEQGAGGMRAWTKEEEKLIEASRAQRSRRKLQRWIWQAVGAVAIFFIGCLAVAYRLQTDRLQVSLDNAVTVAMVQNARFLAAEGGASLNIAAWLLVEAIQRGVDPSILATAQEVLWALTPRIELEKLPRVAEVNQYFNVSDADDIAIGAYEKDTVLIRAATGTVFHHEGSPGNFLGSRNTRFDQSSRYLISCDSDSGSGCSSLMWVGPGPPIDLPFSKLLATGNEIVFAVDDQDGSFKLVELATGKVVAQIPSLSGYDNKLDMGATMSNSGDKVFVYVDSKLLQLKRVEHTLIETVRLPVGNIARSGGFHHLVLSPDQTRLLLHGFGYVNVFDVTSSTAIRHMGRMELSRNTHCSFDNSGGLFFVCIDEVGTAAVISAKSGSLIAKKEFPRMAGWNHNIQMHRELVVIGQTEFNDKVIVWDWRTGKLVGEVGLSDDLVNLWVDQSGNLVTISRNGLLERWSLRDYLSPYIEPRNPTFVVTDLSGSIASIGIRNTEHQPIRGRIWNATNDRTLWEGEAEDYQFSEDGNLVAALTGPYVEILRNGAIKILIPLPGWISQEELLLGKNESEYSITDSAIFDISKPGPYQDLPLPTTESPDVFEIYNSEGPQGSNFLGRVRVAVDFKKSRRWRTCCVYASRRNHIALDAPGKHIAVTVRGWIFVVTLDSIEPVKRFKTRFTMGHAPSGRIAHPDNPAPLFFDQSGENLYYHADVSKLGVINLESGQRKEISYNEAILPAGSLWLNTGERGGACLMEQPGVCKVPTIGSEGMVPVSVSSDGSYAVFKQSSGTHQVLAISGKPLTISDELTDASVFEFDTQAKHLAVGFTHGRVSVFSLKNMVEIMRSEGSGRIGSLNFVNQDSRLLIQREGSRLQSIVVNANSLTFEICSRIRWPFDENTKKKYLSAVEEPFGCKGYVTSSITESNFQE